MKIELKHRVKPNGANEFKLGKDFALETVQVLVMDEAITNEAVLELLTAKAVVAVQAKIRAEFGSGDTAADFGEWSTHVHNWYGREVTPEYLVSATPKGGIAKAVLAVAEAAIAKQVAKGMTRDEAKALVCDMLGIDL